MAERIYGVSELGKALAELQVIKTIPEQKTDGGFTITAHRGFHITFENGWTLSVQWGPCNYGSNYDSLDFDAPRKTEHYHGDTAEVGILNLSGHLVDVFGWGDSVKGHQTADDVAKLIAKVRKIGIKKCPKKK